MALNNLYIHLFLSKIVMQDRNVLGIFHYATPDIVYHNLHNVVEKFPDLSKVANLRTSFCVKSGITEFNLILGLVD